MKKSLFTIVLTTFVSIQSPVVATLSDEYKLLEDRRIAIEEASQKRNERRREQEFKTNDIAEKWGKCSNKRWYFVWEPFINRLEETRNELETKRKDVLKFQQDLNKTSDQLEKKRRAIERKYDGNRGLEYEEEFRDYMSELKNNYLFPYENNYFYAIDRYLTAVEIWQTSAKDALKACEENDISSVLLNRLLKNLDKVFEILDSIRQLLKRS